MRLLIFVFWVIYSSTVGQMVIEVRFRIAKRKAERAWCKFMQEL